MGLQNLQIEKGKPAPGSSTARSLLNTVEVAFSGKKPPLMCDSLSAYCAAALSSLCRAQASKHECPAGLLVPL